MSGQETLTNRAGVVVFDGTATPRGGSQTLDVTLTNVDDDGPTVGAAFTIPAGFLVDGASLNGAILAAWTCLTDQVLDAVVAGSAPQAFASGAPPFPYPAGPSAFTFTATRENDTNLVLRFQPPQSAIETGASIFSSAPLVFTGLDFSDDVLVQLRVTIDGADADNYWHPLAAACTLDAESLFPVLISGLVAQGIAALTNVTGGGTVFVGADGTLHLYNTTDIGVVLSFANGALLLGGNPSYDDIGANYIVQIVGTSTGENMTWGVTPGGYEYFDNVQGVGEPPDANLNAAQRRQWYDPTDGATAFRFKQKSLNGGVEIGKGAALTSDGSAFLGIDKPVLSVGDAAEIMAALVTLGLVVDDT